MNYMDNNTSNNKLNANILLIGKSGVGKSSLLNYIFDDEIAETGAGAPVTKEGIHKNVFNYRDDFTLSTYDSWGLEPNKVEEWKTYVIDEVKKHEKENVSDWFNTIIFCVSAASGRVEDFELDVLRELKKDMNHVIVVITHCQHNNSNTMERASAMKDRIKEAGLDNNDIIYACSCEKKLINGDKVERFGKEEILSQIIINLWKNFKEKLPEVIKEQVEKKFKSEHDSLHEKVADFHFIFRRKHNIEEFEKGLNEDFEKFAIQVINDVNQRFGQAYEYYRCLSKMYCVPLYLNKNELYKDPDMTFSALKQYEIDVDKAVDKITEMLSKVWSAASSKPVRDSLKDIAAESKLYLSSSKSVRKNLHGGIKSYVEKARDEVMHHIDKIEKAIKDIDIEKNYLDPIQAATQNLM